MAMFLIAGNATADTPAAPGFAGGTGTQGDPWQISNLAELRRFMEDSLPGFFPRNSYYKLTANIEASDTATWFGGLGWLPVDASTMQGFDPAGFEIQNLYINRPTTDYVGFFGKFHNLNGPLTSFKFVGGQITGQDYVGVLVGSGDNGLTISNSQSSAIVSGRSRVGGLVGLAGSGTIISSRTTGAVTGTGDIVGGLVGNAAGPSVSSSNAAGPVKGKKQVGGLIGVFTQGSGTGITTSWASGKVDGDDLVGGLIGYSNGKVTFSYATGAVSATGTNPTIVGSALTGGLIGQQASARATEDSWASGAVSGPLSGVGGLIGSNAGPILRSITVAGQTVTGGTNASSVGGLVGDNQGSITASRSASTVEATGTTVQAVGGLVGLNTSAAASITTSYATGSVTAASGNKVGGLIGNHDNGVINASHAHGNVYGLDDVGGLIGFSTTIAINTSHATGTVTGRTNVGGLIGNRGTGVTDTTFATGAVTGSGNYVGGLMGRSNGTVKKSYARDGAVSGQDWVGGLIGLSAKGMETSFAIKSVSGVNRVGGLAGEIAGTSPGTLDCYAQASVTGSDKVGGLVGLNGNGSNITRCYASGTVNLSGAGSIGGLVGDNQVGTTSNTYWNTDTTARPGIGIGSTSGATGLTAAQMKQQASFVGFAFPSPWQIISGSTEPYFDYAAAGQVATTTSLVSSVNPSVAGQSVTFTASLTPNAGTGTVLFQDGTTPLPGCVAVTVTTGQAQCSISTLAVGLHGIRAVYSGDNGNLGSTSSTVNQNVVAATLDIDASNTQTKYDASTDGLLTVRYLFGLTGTSLVAGGVFGGTATRTDPDAIKNYLDGIRPLLDIDGNNSVNALTDGVLIIRYLLGLTNDALISGAVDLQLGTRKTATQIQLYLQTLMP